MSAVSTATHGSEEAHTRAAIGAERLARLVGVPVSVLSFLEARVPQVRSLAEGAGRVYRADDAVLLAGLAELLYDEGLSLREVQAMMDGGAREAIASRGRERLGSAMPATGTAAARAVRPIPEDALVVRKGAGPAAPRRAAAQGREARAILAELIDCVRILEGAR